MLQQFLSNGNLTPGIHTYNINEFKQQFVSSFTNSTTRTTIYANFILWLKQVIKVVPPRYLWLDGSYLTNKIDPNDLDLIMFYYPEDIQSEQQALDLGELIHRDSRKHDCDAYLCYSLEHWPPERLAAIPDQSKIMQRYWMGQFGFDRERQPKGMVQIDRDELLSIITGGVTDERLQ